MQSRPILVLLVGIILAVGLIRSCESPVRVSGMARGVDGDSLEIGETSIRLFGIDAPEGRQNCRRDGSRWDCGVAATRKLEELVGGHALTCTEKDVDSYGRSVAVCITGDTDVGAEMVLGGLALAYRQYSNDYVNEETEARTARRGLWASEFTNPWDWRRNPEPPPRSVEPRPPNDSDDRPDPSGDCRIKGNINREGERIYHVPGSPSYDDTIIDEARGERWFCSEDEARGAAWRAPRG